MMNRPLVLCAVVASLVLGGIAGYAIALFQHRSEPSTTSAPEADNAEKPTTALEERPVIHVTVREVRKQVLSTALPADGIITTAPGAHTSVSLPVDVIIDQISITVGSPVSAGETLGMVHLTPGAVNARTQALVERDAARNALTLIHQRYDLSMASAQDLQQAQQASDLADVKLAPWGSHLTGERFPLTAAAAGVVLTLNTTAGVTVPAGTAILDIAGSGQELRLGLEPAQARLVHAGTVLAITDPRQPGLPALSATVDLVAGHITPETHFQDVLIRLPKETFPIGEMVHAMLEVSLPEALVVPRSTVLMQDKPHVFTVSKGAAHLHAITLVGSAGDSIAIQAADLSVQDQVIVQGDEEITDGALVQVDPTP